MVYKLDQEHLDFLTDGRTLERWAGETMKRRTILFHRRFPNKRIALTSLRKFYLKHGLRRKRVRMEKVMPEATRLVFVDQCRNLVERMGLMAR